MYKKINNYILTAVKYAKGNVGVFCTSYQLLNDLLKTGLKTQLQLLRKSIFIEMPEMKSHENDVMIRKFKNLKDKGAILLGVCGGRNSEGEDFPGLEMTTSIIVGVPFGKPTPLTEAKIKFFESNFPGRGREIAYFVPAFNRANQAAGRPVRKINDKGLIVLLDYRFILPMFKRFLSSWLVENLETVLNINEYEKKVKKFFEKF